MGGTEYFYGYGIGAVGGADGIDDPGRGFRAFMAAFRLLRVGIGVLRKGFSTVFILNNCINTSKSYDM